MPLSGINPTVHNFVTQNKSAIKLMMFGTMGT
jgi:hypothetical protein